MLVVVLARERINGIHHAILCGIDTQPALLSFYVMDRPMYPYEEVCFYSTHDVLSFLYGKYPDVYKFAERVFNDPVTKMFFDMIGFE